jgi:O-acetyl-ADP-ribose deacetylase (regulator of RNase III)
MRKREMEKAAKDVETIKFFPGDAPEPSQGSKKTAKSAKFDVPLATYISREDIRVILGTVTQMRTPAMPFQRIKIIIGDITMQNVDAIVNAANSSLAGGGGVDGAVHRAAGPELAGESVRLAPCPTGEARTTKGYKLPASWVIHTVGPVYPRHTPEEAADLLAAAYRNSLREAVRVGAKTVAFPAISTGVYEYPKEEAACVAMKTVAAFLSRERAIEEVRMICFSEDSAEAHRKALGMLMPEM